MENRLFVAAPALMVFFSLITAFSIPSSTARSFFDDYWIVYGPDHVKVNENEELVQLFLDKYTGSGFKSKVPFGSGYFNIQMKLPRNKDTSGIVSTFYLTSVGQYDISPPRVDDHDEVDFEFYGSDRLPIVLQTNIFVGGHRNREQKVALWFDPREDFHSYTILWNQWQVAFFVDDVPIRVFKNLSHTGQQYMTRPMYLQATIWYADWAAHGRLIDWGREPFVCSYEGFNVQSCPITRPESIQYCHSLNRYNWWNAVRFRYLDARQQGLYEAARKKYMIYDYCSDRIRYPTPPPECNYN